MTRAEQLRRKKHENHGPLTQYEAGTTGYLPGKCFVCSTLQLILLVELERFSRDVVGEIKKQEQETRLKKNALYQMKRSDAPLKLLLNFTSENRC